MIDSVIYYGAGTKPGTLATAIADMSGSALRRFVYHYLDEQGASQAGLNAAEVTRVEIVTQRGLYDAEGNVLTPRATLAGLAFLVATEDQTLADLLWALPMKLCRVQLDRASGSILRTNVPVATLRTLAVEPVFAGSHYDWPTIT